MGGINNATYINNSSLLEMLLEDTGWFLHHHGKSPAKVQGDKANGGSLGEGVEGRG